MLTMARIWLLEYVYDGSEWQAQDHLGSQHPDRFSRRDQRGDVFQLSHNSIFIKFIFFFILFFLVSVFFKSSRATLKELTCISASNFTLVIDPFPFLPSLLCVCGCCVLCPVLCPVCKVSYALANSPPGSLVIYSSIFF